jgi:hypothetical protein
MSVSRRTREAQHSPPATAPELRVPQARVLAALMPANPSESRYNWPVLTRPLLSVEAGYTGTSGTITRALNGIREGSSSGDAHPGLLARGLVEEVPLDIDGLIEVNYRVTAAGIREYQAWVAAGGKLPAIKDSTKNTNRRYRR